MRMALPIWHCLNKQSKLALLDALKSMGETTFDEPQPVWAEWPALELIDFKPVVHTEKEKEYIQSHLDAVNRMMSQAPSRSRG